MNARRDSLAVLALTALMLSTMHASAQDNAKPGEGDRAVNYIIVFRVEGASDEDIMQKLGSMGYDKEDIRTLMQEAEKKQNTLVEDLQRMRKEGTDEKKVEAYLKSQQFTDEQTKKIIEYLKKAANATTQPTRAPYPQTTSPQTTKPRVTLDLITNLTIIALLVVLIAAVAYVYWKSRKHKREGEKDDVGELDKLQKEKRDIEELIELAKKKYHSRKLDEESFREIVRDHQKKLIEIESKISNMEKRVKRLEERA